MRIKEGNFFKGVGVGDYAVVVVIVVVVFRGWGIFLS